MAVAIQRDSALDAEALLLAGLHADTVYARYEIRFWGYTLAEGSTLLHLAAAFDAPKCAKVRQRICT